MPYRRRYINGYSFVVGLDGRYRSAMFGIAQLHDINCNSYSITNRKCRQKTKKFITAKSAVYFRHIRIIELLLLENCHVLKLPLLSLFSHIFKVYMW